MVKDSKEPRKFDVVKGGQVPPPVSGAVLGGIKALRQRFASEDEQVRLYALVNASKYGNEGINILVQALKDWCKDNNLSLSYNKNEYRWEFQARIFDAIKERLEIELLNKFWEYTVSGRLAFVVELIIDRKCYLQASCLDLQ